MKSNRFTDFLWSYLFIVVQLVYLLLEPLIFATVGAIFQVSWLYYLVSIGGYYAFTALWELAVHFMTEEGSKKIHSPFVRKLRTIRQRFAQSENIAEEERKEEN